MGQETTVALKKIGHLHFLWEARQMRSFCTVPGRVNIERSVCFFGFHLLEILSS